MSEIWDGFCPECKDGDILGKENLGDRWIYECKKCKHIFRTILTEVLDEG